MKILIAGDGKVGAALTKQLSAEGHDITLIDSDPKVLETTIAQYDVMTVIGNCAAKSVLMQAGVMEADLLITATSADEVNLLCCMTAHGLNPKLHTIARIRNPEYTDQIYQLRDLFGLSMIINPEKQAATEIARLLKYPGFLKRDTFAKGRVEIVELRVDEKSKLCNLPLMELNSVVRCKVLVCAVLRDGQAITPRGSFQLQEGDRVFVTASAENLTTLLENLELFTHKVRRVLLCGGGRVSYYLAQQLEKSGISVQIIEKDYERCLQLSEKLPSANIIHGDASSQQLLESEHLSRCDAMVNLTGLDELNMVLSLYGNSHGVRQCITKIGRTEYSGVIDSLALGSTISPKELCCNTIVRYVRAMENQSGAAVAVHFIADGQVEAIEFKVDSSTLHYGTPLKDLKLKKNILIVCINRNEKIEFPSGNSSFLQGDRLIVASSSDQVIRQLNDIFES